MSLEIHFVNVGHGDCTIIKHPSGRITVIDINNSKALPEEVEADLRAHHGVGQIEWIAKREKLSGLSFEDHYKSLLDDPVDFLAETYPGEMPFRYIQTHPDMDHMGGLSRLLVDLPPQVFWDTSNRKERAEEGFDKGPHDFADWNAYQEVRGGTSPQVLNNLRGAWRNYWDEDAIEVLAPTQELLDSANDAEKWNRSSYVLRVSHAGRSVLLPGDADVNTWESIDEALDKDDLNSAILKAAHHGRESGYHEASVEKIDPDVVICSVGKKPSTDASYLYRRHADSVFSTRFNGTISVVVGDSGEVDVYKGAGELLLSLAALA